MTLQWLIKLANERIKILHFDWLLRLLGFSRTKD